MKELAKHYMLGIALEGLKTIPTIGFSRNLIKRLPFLWQLPAP
jgi:hypothetical protein